MNPSEWHFLYGRAFECGAKSIATQMQAETIFFVSWGAFE